MTFGTIYESYNDWNKTSNHITGNLIELMGGENKLTDALLNNLKVDFKQWFLSREYTKNTFFDARTYYDCFEISHLLNNEDIDFLEVFIGKVGSGKSTLALQKCCNIDPLFSLNQIFNHPKQIFQWVHEHKGKTRGRAMLLDEGVFFTFSRDVQTDGSKDMIRFLNICRQFNMYIAICIPEFNLIDAHIRRHRISRLTSIEKPKKSFRSTIEQGIEKINMLCVKKGLSLSMVKSAYDYYGYWNSNIPNINNITEKGYKELKLDYSDSFLVDTLEKYSSKENKLLSTGQTAKLMGKHPCTIRNWADEGIIPFKRINGKRYIDYNEAIKFNIEKL